MCGIFGFAAATPKRHFNQRTLAAIARDTERRGPHAFGFAWMDSNDVIHSFKQTGRISDHLGVLKMAADAKLFIGHCRWATHGDPEDNANNHPHVSGDGWLVHNGVIGNYREINRRFRLRPKTECDSETLALLVATLSDNRAEAMAEALEMISPPAAVAGLWDGELYIARHGNPLAIGTTDAGVYFASYPTYLPDDGHQMPDGLGLRMRFDGRRLRVETAFRLAC